MAESGRRRGDAVIARPLIDVITDRPGFLAASPERRGQLLRAYLSGLIISIGGTDAAKALRDVSLADTTLSALGIDSPAVITIKRSIEADLGARVTVWDLVDGASIADLAVLLDERLGDETVPLPASRERTSPWFTHQIEPVGAVSNSAVSNSVVSNSAVALRLDAEMNIPALESALGILMARHASLRCGCPGPEIPVRSAARRTAAWLREIDARHLDDPQLTSWLERAAGESFDAACGPLFRIYLYRRAAGTVVLVMAHHTVTDLTSMTALIRELEVLYAEHAGGESAPPPEPGGAQRDFVRLYRWVRGSRMPGHAVQPADFPMCLSGR